MTTRRPRLQITLSDPVWALVEEVHVLTGTPKAAIISEILDEVAPVFQTQIEALRVLQDSPQEAVRLIQRFSNENVSRLMQSSLDLDSAVDARTVEGRKAKRRKGNVDGTP